MSTRRLFSVDPQLQGMCNITMYQ